VNPEIEEEVPIQRIIDTLKTFIYIAVYLPYRIESLKSVDERNVLITKYIWPYADPKSTLCAINGDTFEVSDELVAKLLNA
jgi:hypothetical protein